MMMTDQPANVAGSSTGVWKELSGSQAPLTDSYRRGLQKAYFGAILAVLASKDAGVNETDASSLLRADLFRLKEEVDAALPRAKAPLTVYHLKDIQHRISSVLQPPKS